MKYGVLSGIGVLVVAAGAVFVLGLVHVGSLPASAGGGAVTLHYQVVGSDDGDVGPDGNKHDTFKALDPTTVKVGQTVTIEVKNLDDVPHGMSFPDLKINKMIAAGKDGAPSITTFTFTATSPGTYRWFCPIPCDTDNNMWAMTPDGTGKGLSRDKFMAGYITVS